MKKYIAFSGGVESTAMCVLYGKGATAVFTDTGSEHKYMYSRIDKVEKKLNDLHGGDFEIKKIGAKVDIKGTEVTTLTDYIKATLFLPGRRERYCTRIFKIAVMDAFLKDKGECELLIGLNADEDREGNYGLLSDVHYRCPLQDDNITREMCIKILNDVGLSPKFPAYMRRGGCIFCPFKSKKEYAAMVHLSYDEIIEVMEIEEMIQDERGKYFRIRDNMPAMRKFIEDEKNNLFGDLSPYYDDSLEQYSCGVFCHR